MLFKRAYERGFRDGARLAVEVVEEVLQAMKEEREEELCACSPGGTDAEDELPEFHSIPWQKIVGSPTPHINPEDGSKHYGCSCWDLHRGYTGGTLPPDPDLFSPLEDKLPPIPRGIPRGPSTLRKVREG
ncbi:MAG: hypothetical protein PHQ43_14975 [Dehalococcoidales bacterium]|nr:hypothetical protein [Dehalococcoidales bacterium]